MSELTWHGVGAAEEAPVGFLRRVEVEGAAVCLGRTADGWVAFQDTCTHEECSLSDGELEGGVIVCPCHASEFDLRTGDVLCPPALEPLPIFEARVEAGELQVRLGAAARRRRGGARAGGSRLRDGRPRRDDRRARRSRGSSLDDVDLTDLDVWEQGVPYEWLTLLRREAPLFWQPEADGRGFWVFTRYDDIVQMSKDWETYSSEVGGTSLEDLTPEEVEARKSMLDTDPPAHTRLRALVNKGFTPRVVNTYEERIRGLARGILAQAFERDAFDWVEDVASEIPMWVFSEIMGLPVEDRRLLIELGDKLLGNTDPEVVGEENLRELTATDPSIRLLPFSSPFATELIEYGCRLGEARRADPRDDVTTQLVEAEIDGSRLSRARVRAVLHPPHDGRERDDAAHDQPRPARPARPPRGDGAPDRRPVARRARRPTRSCAGRTPCTTSAARRRRDVTIHGRRIKAGDKVTMWYASGNYDEEKFADPFRLDLGRQPNRHLTFGLGGPHFCLGAHLAKLEVRIWLEEMVPYLDRIELAGTPTRLRSNFFNGIKRLPVRVRA